MVSLCHCCVSSYYVRDGKANQPDTFGSTYLNFSDYKNPTFIQELRNTTWEPQSFTTGAGGGGGVRVGGVSSENGAVVVVRLSVVGVLGCVLALVCLLL